MISFRRTVMPWFHKFQLGMPIQLGDKLNFFFPVSRIETVLDWQPPEVQNFIITHPWYPPIIIPQVSFGQSDCSICGQYDMILPFLDEKNITQMPVSLRM